MIGLVWPFGYHLSGALPERDAFKSNDFRDTYLEQQKSAEASLDRSLYP